MGGGGGSDTAVVDSGSTMLLLRRALYMSLVAQFQARYCHLQAVCTSPSVLDPPVDGVQSCLEDLPYGEWPVLELALDGVQLFLPPDLYFVQSNNKYCFAVQPTPDTAGDMNIIGDAVLRGFYTVYDRVSKKVGFAAANADACGFPGGGTVNRPPSEGLDRDQMTATVAGCVVVFPLLVVLMAVYRDPMEDATLAGLPMGLGWGWGGFMSMDADDLRVSMDADGLRVRAPDAAADLAAPGGARQERAASRTRRRGKGRRGRSLISPRGRLRPAARRAGERALVAGHAKVPWRFWVWRCICSFTFWAASCR